ncbi:MAG: ATP-dependent DNA helicase [Leptolyngbyaceae cyanobacterium bins.59]|nr:ATP-dependent DNA helicase [Leptolyngbyaceae cyanobacterium bins.59]
MLVTLAHQSSSDEPFELFALESNPDNPPVIEVEVHQRLRAFLREQGEPLWPHHLTMGRLVARALRLERSVLIQTGALSSTHQGRYRLSYLVPVLMWPGPVILVVSEAIQQRLLRVEIPQLRQWIQTHKPIRTGDSWPEENFQGLLITSPERWIADRFAQQKRFPSGVLTIIDGVDDLESQVLDHLTTCVRARDWEDLMLACPDKSDLIRNIRVQLTHSVFQHPANPYECYVLEPSEYNWLLQLHEGLTGLALSSGETPDLGCFPEIWQRFWQCFISESSLLWVTVSRQFGQFSLHGGPITVADSLATIWPKQPVVLIGSALDSESEAPTYRQRVGLGDITSLKFAPDRHHELIQLYLPDGVPMPNTVQFQPALLHEIRKLLTVSAVTQGVTVLLIGDVPLKAQIGSILASEFGSRVQVEKTCLDDNGILITGWQFWHRHQDVLPAPRLLVVATLPIPSLEDPIVAGRVNYYKRHRQDWFRLYLLPEAINELQRAVAPVRDNQGVVALLDSRVIHRSYGQQILAALSPLARINYLDPTLFGQVDSPTDLIDDG